RTNKITKEAFMNVELKGALDAMCLEGGVKKASEEIMKAQSRRVTSRAIYRAITPPSENHRPGLNTVYALHLYTGLSPEIIAPKGAYIHSSRPALKGKDLIRYCELRASKKD
ncbi:MAG: hypothetical protein NE330_02805, partial [Lentisphaeraceae bacterium]|nr:hypothetical protein [Lentisphaeraceae bacterium]